jgi:hypothetical protein
LVCRNFAELTVPLKLGAGGRRSLAQASDDCALRVAKHAGGVQFLGLEVEVNGMAHADPRANSCCHQVLTGASWEVARDRRHDVSEPLNPLKSASSTPPQPFAKAEGVGHGPGFEDIIEDSGDG